MTTLPNLVTVTDSEGRVASLNPSEYADEARRQVRLELENGGQIFVSRDLLVRDGDAFRLRFDLRDAAYDDLQAGERVVVPVIEEEATFSKRAVKSGTVRIRKEVVHETVTVDQPLFAEKIDVQRIAIDQPVEVAPQPRQDGDTWIIPIVEEVVVIEKRLILREEVRVTRQRIPVHTPQQVELRRERITVERYDSNGKRTDSEA